MAEHRSLETDEMTMDNRFQALQRECGLAAQHIGVGVTSLGKANYAQKAYYAQAFFALSIGFERSAKIALVVDHALSHAGEFPSGHTLKRFGHDLRKLLDTADAIGLRRARRTAAVPDRLPRTSIHDAIIAVLNDFASNVTRYYNLDVLTWGAGARAEEDPVRVWHEQVTEPVLTKHWSPAARKRVERNAELADVLLGDIALVRHHSESGKELTTLGSASFETGRAEAAARHVRVYVLQIARFIFHLMWELTFTARANQLHHIPYMHEFFAIFNNEDAYFRRRKSWSIY